MPALRARTLKQAHGHLARHVLLKEPQRPATLQRLFGLCLKGYSTRALGRFGSRCSEQETKASEDKKRRVFMKIIFAINIVLGLGVLSACATRKDSHPSAGGTMNHEQMEHCQMNADGKAPMSCPMMKTGQMGMGKGAMPSTSGPVPKDKAGEEDHNAHH